MLNSEKSALLSKIKETEARIQVQYSIAISKAIGVINRCKWLSEEQKIELIEGINK